MSSKDDAKTLEAIEKIKAVLREYDLFAAFTVVSTVRVHWVYHTDPSWSCLSIDDSGRATIRAKRADFATPEQHKRVVELTVGAIASCRDLGQRQSHDMSQLYEVVSQQMVIEHRYSDLRLGDKG